MKHTYITETIGEFKVLLTARDGKRTEIPAHSFRITEVKDPPPDLSKPLTVGIKCTPLTTS